MALVYPYQIYSTPQPIVTLNGRRSRSYPIIDVTLIGPGGTAYTPGLLDTGADDTVFPDSFAPRLGIDLTNAPTGSASGVGVVAATLRYAEVTLRIAATGERREWRAMVAFTSTRLRCPLLGFAGFLQFFTATFRGEQEEVELVVNGLYPGT